MHSPALLVIFSAFLHALWNALLKRESKNDADTTVMLAIAALSAIGLSLFEKTPAYPDHAALFFAAGAGLAEATYFHCLTRALAGAPLGFAYPLSRGGSILLVWPLSILFFGEQLAIHRLLGGAIITGGLLLVAGAHRPSKRAVLFIAGAAMSIATYHLGYKFALERHAAPLALNATTLTLASLLNLVAAHDPKGALGALRRHPVSLASAGIISTVSFAIFLFALRTEGAGLVLTLRNTAILFSQGFALALGERPTRNQLIGCLFVALGGAVVSSNPGDWHLGHAH